MIESTRNHFISRDDARRNARTWWRNMFAESVSNSKRNGEKEKSKKWFHTRSKNARELEEEENVLEEEEEFANQRRNVIKPKDITSHTGRKCADKQEEKEFAEENQNLDAGKEEFGKLLEKKKFAREENHTKFVSKSTRNMEDMDIQIIMENMEFQTLNMGNSKENIMEKNMENIMEIMMEDMENHANGNKEEWSVIMFQLKNM